MEHPLVDWWSIHWWTGGASTDNLVLLFRPDKLEAGFTRAYPWIATIENTEYCQAVVEANFFPVIMPPLQTAFRCITYSSEMAVARSMCLHVNATPKDLSVRRKFWLLEQVSGMERGVCV